MHPSVALPSPRPLRIRPLFAVLMLVALVALGFRIAAGFSGHQESIQQYDLGLALREAPGTPVVHQSAATACFAQGMAAIRTVRTEGPNLLIGFTDQHTIMRIRFYPTARDAIRASFTKNGPGNAGNTLWPQTPTHLSKADTFALNTCLPVFGTEPK